MLLHKPFGIKAGLSLVKRGITKKYVGVLEWAYTRDYKRVCWVLKKDY